MNYLFIFIRVALLALGQSLDCHSANEVNLMDMGNQSMYNHNKAQQSKNRVHISWDILYMSMTWGRDCSNPCAIAMGLPKSRARSSNFKTRSLGMEMACVLFGYSPNFGLLIRLTKNSIMLITAMFGVWYDIFIHSRILTRCDQGPISLIFILFKFVENWFRHYYHHDQISDNFAYCMLPCNVQSLVVNTMQEFGWEKTYLPVNLNQE